jgi:hypothetical protein
MEEARGTAAKANGAAVARKGKGCRGRWRENLTVGDAKAAGGDRKRCGKIPEVSGGEAQASRKQNFVPRRSRTHAPFGKSSLVARPPARGVAGRLLPAQIRSVARPVASAAKRPFTTQTLSAELLFRLHSPLHFPEIVDQERAA